MPWLRVAALGDLAPPVMKSAYASLQANPDVGERGAALLVLLVFLWGGLTAYLSLKCLHAHEMRHWKKKLSAQCAEAIAKDGKLLEMVMKEIPSWVVYPDFDRVRWLNDVLKEIFPHLQRGITTLVQGTVDPMLDKMKPIFLRTLGIREFTLGNAPPYIAGIKTIPSFKDEVILEMSLRWNSEAKLTLELATHGALLPAIVGISGIQISGQLRITLRPLMPVIPGFGGVAVTFVEPPHVDCKLEGVGKALEIVPGLVPFLLSLVDRIIAQMLVFPKKIIVPLVEGSLDELVPKPNGILRVVVIRAADLPQKNLVNSSMLSFVPGMSTDPKAKLTVKGFCQDQVFTTKTKYATLNPVFEEVHDFVIEDLMRQHINVDVCDSDEINAGVGNAKFAQVELSNTILSKGDLSLREVFKNPNVKEQSQVTEARVGLYLPAKAQKQPGGQLMLHLTYIPLRETDFEPSKQASMTAAKERNYSFMRRKSSKGEPVPKSMHTSSNMGALITIRVEKAKELIETQTKKDPFVEMLLLDPNTYKTINQARTTTKYNTLDPLWDEEFYFLEYDAITLSTLELRFNVYDDYSNDGFGMIESFADKAVSHVTQRKQGKQYAFMGALVVPLTDLFRNRRMKGSYDLSEIQSGMLYLDLRVQYFNM